MSPAVRGPTILVLAVLALSGCAAQAPLAGLDAADALPRPKTTWLALGWELLERNRPALAHDAFVRSLRVEAVTAAALTGAGVAAARQGLVGAARRHFERAAEIEPGSVAAHNNLGAMLYAEGELHAARKAFETAFAISSGTSGQAARNLGIAELALRRAETEEPAPAEKPVRIQRVGVAEYRLLSDSDRPAQGEG